MGLILSEKLALELVFSAIAGLKCPDNVKPLLNARPPVGTSWPESWKPGAIWTSGSSTASGLSTASGSSTVSGSATASTSEPEPSLDTSWLRSGFLPSPELVSSEQPDKAKTNNTDSPATIARLFLQFISPSYSEIRRQPVQTFNTRAYKKFGKPPTKTFCAGAVITQK